VLIFRKSPIHPLLGIMILSGRIIEERRMRLAPEMVEMLLCMKDWELGEARGQHCTQDQELEDAFEGLYLDDS
jgi:hypothetical protein